jgi:hypothetical protein
VSKRSKKIKAMGGLPSGGPSDLLNHGLAYHLSVARKIVSPEVACASVICGGYFYAMAHHADSIFCTVFATYSLTALFVWAWMKRRGLNE